MVVMFTGIITNIGIIEEVNGAIYKIHAKDFGQSAIGSSIACSGICLTVIESFKDWFSVQVSEETSAKTTIQNWRVGDCINLEKAMKLGDELGGHIVTGHIDGVGLVKSIEKLEHSWRITFCAPKDLAPFIASKGSIAIDGISLTVNDVSSNEFTTNIIAHSWKHTTIQFLRKDSSVNLEIDILARYIKRMMSCSEPS